jgi:EAL domain-containing protein (putative c-di-GMP-specific phosphodiesterase class I)
MARGLGVRVIAEGVETEHQASLLAELGCGLAQGYLYAPPIRPEEIESLLGRSIPVTAALPAPAPPS